MAQTEHRQKRPEKAERVPRHTPSPKKAVYATDGTPAGILARVPHPPKGRKESTEARITGLYELVGLDLMPDVDIMPDLGELFDGLFMDLDLSPADVFAEWDPLDGFNYDITDLIGAFLDLLPQEITDAIDEAVNDLLNGSD